MLFALLVLVLCAAAGLAALTAAFSNVGRYIHLESDQREYLSVSSAIGFLRGKLTGGAFSARLTLTATHTWWYETDPADPTKQTRKDETKNELSSEPYEGFGADNELLTGLMSAYCAALFENSYVPDEFFTGTRDCLSLPPSVKKELTVSGIDGLSEVTVELTLDGRSFNITMEVKTRDSGLYTARITAVAQVTAPPPESETTYSEDGGNGVETTVTTVHITVRWPEDGITVTRADNGEGGGRS